MKKVSIILIFSFIVLTLLFSGCTTGEGWWSVAPVPSTPTPGPTPDSPYLGIHLECVSVAHPEEYMGYEAACVPVANTIINQPDMCDSSDQCTYKKCIKKISYDPYDFEYGCFEVIHFPFEYVDDWIVDRDDECSTNDECIHKRCSLNTISNVNECRDYLNTRHDEYGNLIDERDDCQTDADCECDMHQPPGNTGYPGDPESNFFEKCYGHGCTDSQVCQICPTDTEDCTCLELCSMQITEDEIITDEDEASAKCAGADLSCNCLPGQELIYCLPVIIGEDPTHYGCACGPQIGE